jgi:AcrR family transcriptional regulator
MPDPSPRWRRRSDARPQEILAAALAMFGERGFAATRLDDLAKRAGISKGTLYLYFPNKEELFKAVVREYLVSRIDVLEERVAHYPGPTIDLIDGLIEELARRVLLSDAAVLPKLIIGEAHNFPDLTRFYAEEVVGRIFRVIQAITARGVARGEFRELPVEAVAPPLVGPMMLASIWKTVMAPHVPGVIDIERLLATHHQTMRRLLLKDEGERS